MESRPKRSTRNQKPTYTFEKEEDFFNRTLTEKRKNDILAMLKRDLEKESTAADVGSSKHLEKLGREIRVIPNQLREWLGIADDLTQVTTSSHSSMEKIMVREASRREALDKLGKDLGKIKRQFDDFLESDRNFQRGNQLSDGELMDLEEEIQDVQEKAKQVQKAVQPKEELKWMPTAEPSSVQEERPMLVKSSMDLDEDDDTEVEDDLSIASIREERHSAFLAKWRGQMEKMQADIKQRIRAKMDVESESSEQSVGNSSSEYETADDADENMEESQSQPQQAD